MKINNKKNINKNSRNKKFSIKINKQEQFVGENKILLKTRF